MILLAIPAMALTLVSVAAFFGRWSWVLDVLANFRAQYAVALLFMGIWLLIGRWKRTAAAVLAGAVVNLAVIAPLYLGDGATSPPVEPKTIMSFNLLSPNQQFAEVAEFIRDADPDVVFLHEASRPWEVAIDAADLGYEVTRSRSEELIFGTLVLSRPGDPVTSYGFTVRGARAVEVIHDGIAVLAIHPLAPTTAERSALRNAQFEFAAQWAGDQTAPHVITGDFNATPWSYPFRKLLADTGMRNSQAGFGLGASFPADGFVAWRVAIDHLVHSPDIAVADRRLGPPLGSDHFPLIVEVWVPG
ncbi:endonuclease/exonuclease/phosphatase family protein [soil metagenome]